MRDQIKKPTFISPEYVKDHIFNHNMWIMISKIIQSFQRAQVKFLSYLLSKWVLDSLHAVAVSPHSCVVFGTHFFSNS